MKLDRIDGNEERRILTAMIVDGSALGRIAAKWEKDMFASKWANLLGGWCVKYYQDYGKPPKRHVESLFETWAGGAKDKETIQLVDRFISGLSGEYASLRQGINSDYVVDLAAKSFTRSRLERAIAEAQSHLESGRVSDAATALAAAGFVELGEQQAIDVLADKAAVQDAFAENEEDLIVYPGPLGYFFRGQLYRGGFVVFMAPEKRGKSWWLIDLSWRAMCQRKRVAFFAAGDMSQRQMMRRFMIRAAKHPASAKEWPLTVRVPRIMRRHEDEVQVKWNTLDFKRPLDWQKAWAAAQELVNEKVRGKDYLRLSCHPNSTLSAKAIDVQLERWAQEGWMADVVVIDYMDIMDESAALPGVAERRHKIDANFRAVRRLAQERHVLAVTATQSNADSYNSRIISRSNFSESKTKHAHPTGVIGINQTHEEKENEVFRLNWVAVREGEYSERNTVATAACLALGNPCVRSCF